MSKAFDVVSAALPGAEDRPGQREMAALVGSAIANRRRLIMQAGTSGDSS